MWEMSYEGDYCENCDGVFDGNDMVVVPVDEWGERYGCPLCGHVFDGVFMSDYFTELGLYLLSVADEEDYAWPGMSTLLPKYEA